MDVRAHQRLARQAKREVRSGKDRQLREVYGIDPQKDLIIISVTMCDDSPEHRVFGATYTYRDEIYRAGFVWDRDRGFWYAAGTLPRLEIPGVVVKQALPPPEGPVPSAKGS